MEEVQKIGVYINKRGVLAFLKKVEEFLDPGKDTEKGNPRNQPLLANISSIRAATLECFWTEPTAAFPDSDLLSKLDKFWLEAILNGNVIINIL